ncbi:MAG: hypothetical protein PHN42_00680 [Bacilli bacterium]|nr:hypothetical protein [Bacilli bacterium]
MDSTSTVNSDDFQILLMNLYQIKKQISLYRDKNNITHLLIKEKQIQNELKKYISEKSNNERNDINDQHKRR